MSKRVYTFIRENKWISFGLLLAVSIIAAYILTIDLPEWFNGGEILFSIFFQLSIGYIINFMFYITQVYVPNNKRNEIAKKSVKKRIQKIKEDMLCSITSLSDIYLDRHKGEQFSDDELIKIVKSIKYDDEVKIINAVDLQPFSVREWLKSCIIKTETQIDKIYQYYANYISAHLMDILEKIQNSDYHRVMKTLLYAGKNVNFNKYNGSFFIQYYSLVRKLDEILENDYKDV